MTLPNSLEAEQGVLGCILLSPLECLVQCREKLASSEAFHDIRCRIIYEAMAEMDRGNIKIDAITVQQFLKDRSLIEGVGGLSYLAALPDSASSAANLDHYLTIVVDKFRLRQMALVCADVVAGVHQANDVDEFLDKAESDVSRICQREKSSQHIKSNEAAASFSGDMDSRMTRKGPSGIITGFHDLDQLTDGIQFGEQFVIGARPSIGKTAIGLNIFMRACLLDGISSIFISLEQSHTALMRRLASAYCHVRMNNLKSGNFTEDEVKQLQAFTLRYRASPATIYDFVSTGASATMIAAVIKRASRNGARLAVIDYLQKIRPVNKHEKRTYEVGETSGILRSAAVESGIAMVTLAQLNRESEKEKGRMPKLTDLADSGQIERDADTVGLLHRDRASGVGSATLCIAKQRDGETGIVNLHFQGQFCEFVNGTHSQ